MSSYAASTSSPGKSAARRQQLCEKMVLRVVQAHNKAHPEALADGKVINVVRHQLNEMLLEGPVYQRDIDLLVKMLSKSATPQKGHGEQGPARSAVKGSEVSVNRGTKKSSGSVVKAGTGGKEGDSLAQQQQNFSETDPYGILKGPQVPNDPVELHNLAQQVRSLPPIQQKKMLLGMSTGPWSAKIQKDLEDEAKRNAEEKKKQQQLREEQRLYLDQQVRQREGVRVQEKVLEARYAAEEAVQRESWKETEEEVIRRRRDQTMALKQDLMEQRALAQQRRQEEEKLRKVEEASKVEALQVELQREEQEKKLKKDKVRQEISTYIEFNSKMKTEKEKEKRLLLEQDVQALREYEAKLERQEEERKTALKRLYDRQSKQFQLAEAQHQTLQALVDADESKARREMEVKDHKQAQEDEHRRQKHKEETLKMKAVVENQIREKEERKKALREEALRLKDEMVRNAQLAEAKDNERRKQAKEFALQGLKDIDKQLVEMHARRFESPYLKIGEKGYKRLEGSGSGGKRKANAASS